MRLTISTEDPAWSGAYALHFHYQVYYFAPMTTWHNHSVYGVRTKWTYCAFHLGTCAKDARPCNTPHATTGVAKCSPHDNFNRWVGRKLALTRALVAYRHPDTKHFMPKRVIAAIWAAYLAKCPPPSGRPKVLKEKPNASVGAIPRGNAA
jgi:hypothetical protein